MPARVSRSTEEPRSLMRNCGLGAWTGEGGAVELSGDCGASERAGRVSCHGCIKAPFNQPRRYSPSACLPLEPALEGAVLGRWRELEMAEHAHGVSLRVPQNSPATAARSGSGG